MGKILIPGGFGGGVTSDDVTATKNHLLQGVTAVTADSDDEPIEGVIQVVDTSRDNYTKTRTTAFGIDLSRMTMYMHLPQGNAYYMRPDGTPHVEIDAQALGDARPEQLLKGASATSKNGLTIHGTIEPRGTWVIASEVVNAPYEATLHARFEEGYYNGDGHYKPTAKIPYAVLTSVLDIDANKMLSNLSVAGVTGKIKMINTQDNNYRLNKSTTFGIDNWSDRNNPIFYVDLPYGNAYYNRPDGHPHVCIDADRLGNSTADRVVAGSTFTSKNGVAVQGQIVDRGDGGAVSYLQGREDWANRMWVLFKNGWYHRNPYDDGQGHIHEAFVYVTYEQLKNLFGIDAAQMLQGYGIAGVQGAIQRWICTTGDIISAYNGEGFAWDDNYAGRGRGIIAKIPQGRYIQGANWVFLPSPNLHTHNVVKDININGVIGTRDWADKVSNYIINDNVRISQLNRGQQIALGNAFSNSETIFVGIDLVGEDVDAGFVRRDKGNGRYLVGRIPVSKSDSNMLATYIRGCPVQLEVLRDGVGNISLIHHGPNLVLGEYQISLYIYAHSSISFKF